jgi:hypothetical protein
MKPSLEQMQHALEVAVGMREKEEDPDYLSRTLLYLQHRIEVLEQVHGAANEYMHFGQEERQHARLQRALEAVRNFEIRESNQDKQDLGL